MKMIDVLAVLCWMVFAGFLFTQEDSLPEDKVFTIVALVVSCVTTIIAVTIHWR